MNINGNPFGKPMQSQCFYALTDKQRQQVAREYLQRSRHAKRRLRYERWEASQGDQKEAEE